MELVFSSHREVGMSILDRTMQKSGKWLDELKSQLNLPNRDQASAVFRVVLHSLRNRLSTDEIAKLGAQMPLFIRGLYYEDWNPAAKPLKDKTCETFLEEVRRALPGFPSQDAEHIVRSVFQLLAVHLSPGAIHHVQSNLPAELSALFPVLEAKAG